MIDVNLRLKSSLQQAAGNLLPLRNSALILDPLANPAATRLSSSKSSCGECARCFGSTVYGWALLNGRAFKKQRMGTDILAVPVIDMLKKESDGIAPVFDQMPGFYLIDKA